MSHSQKSGSTDHNNALIFYTGFSAWLPDIDNLFYLGGKTLYLAHHRGYTHSLLGIMFLSLVTAFVFKNFGLSKHNLVYLWLLGWAAMSLHIFQDLLNSYGTMIFLPFSSRAASIPLIFIIDPFYTGILIFLLFRLFPSGKITRKSASLLALIWIFLWPAISAGSYYYSIQRLATLHSNKITLLPDLLTPFNWKIIVESDSAYLMGWYSIFYSSDRLSAIQFTEYDKIPNKLQRSLSAQEKALKDYFRFSSHTVWEDHTDHYEFFDLRFITSWPPAKSRAAGSGSPMSIHVYLDANGKYKDYSYQHSSPAD